jgi:hypothetical protein
MLPGIAGPGNTVQGVFIDLRAQLRVRDIRQTRYASVLAFGTSETSVQQNTVGQHFVELRELWALKAFREVRESAGTERRNLRRKLSRFCGTKSSSRCYWPIVLWFGI